MAKGEYSIYCDSDDTVSYNYYLPMLKKAVEADADIVINDWATHTDRARYYARRDETVRGNIDASFDEILPLFAGCEGRQHSFYVLWNKLYRTEKLRSAFDTLASLGFDEGSSYSEDAALNFFIWKDSKRVVNIHSGYYFYRIHPTQSVVFASEEKLRRQIDSMALTLDIMRENVGEHPRREEILRSLDAWSALMARSHYSQAKGADYPSLYGYIKENTEWKSSLSLP